MSVWALKYWVSEGLVLYTAEKKRGREPEVLWGEMTCQGHAAGKGWSIVMTNFQTKSCIPWAKLPLNKSILLQNISRKILLLSLGRIIKNNTSIGFLFHLTALQFTITVWNFTYFFFPLPFLYFLFAEETTFLWLISQNTYIYLLCILLCILLYNRIYILFYIVSAYHGSILQNHRISFIVIKGILFNPHGSVVCISRGSLPYMLYVLCKYKVSWAPVCLPDSARRAATQSLAPES